MGNESPELIEREMEQTRESLSEKVALLEKQVLGTVQSTTGAVQETVDSVKSAVQETVEAVRGSVSESVSTISERLNHMLDVRAHVQSNPWGMVGGAAALGFLTGLVVFRRDHQRGSDYGYRSSGAASFASSAPAASESHRPSWLNDIFDMAGREVKRLAEQAIATASASLKQTVDTRMPDLIHGVMGQRQQHGSRNGHADPMAQAMSDQHG